MCGIACIFNIKQQTPELRQKALSMAKRYATAVRTGVAFTAVEAPYWHTSVFPLSIRNQEGNPSIQATEKSTCRKRRNL